MSSLFALNGRIQPYAWGGRQFIPALLRQTATSQPAAEYWLGDHPGAPAEVVIGDHIQPVAAVLPAALPFLLKVLDVGAMLSIQVHPTRAQAQAGFAREDAAGIARDGATRNYKDQNDKPELMVALSPFYLLHGFAETATIAARLARYAVLAPLAETLEQQGLKIAFAQALDHRNPVVAAMQADLAQTLPARAFAKTDVEFWYQRWLASDSAQARGLLTLFFFNLLELPAGAAIYQPAGLLHAYLEGQNIELMANSDNVLRAGLTPKHIDVEELLAVGNIAATDPSRYIIKPESGAPFELHYPTPFNQFALSRLQGPASGRLTPRGTEIWLAMAGACEIKRGDEQLIIEAGQAALLLPGSSDIEVRLDNAASVFRAMGAAA